MYEGKNESIDWVKLILKVVICILIFLLILKIIAVILTNKKEKVQKNVMSENLTKIEDKLKESLTDEMIPNEVGDSNKYTFKELEKIIGTIKDENDEKCDYDKSYIEIIKLDSEVQIKTYLSCLNNDDYSNLFIKKENKKETTTTKAKTKTTTTTKKVTTTRTTKSVTTTTKEITIITTTTNSNDLYIGFNVGIGNDINPMRVENGKSYILPVPTKEGYEFVGWYYENIKYDTITIKDNSLFKKCILNGTSYNNCIILKAKWIKK